ncbi:leucyl aminopeptidase [Paenibacillus sp. OV219]|uniref:leucyl aminopeptidase n=1 Tax=Paenibacillus sp. OV219 TaxID=1884377 RepID=UPI0008C77758|nr:leucyl aminopeptidase [Paenibacillus sp. OV219]SEN82364.1 leucyl aminopeptidase [Paenibacillus sp. OV219]
MSVQFIYASGPAACGAADVTVVFVTKDELKQSGAAGQKWVHPQLDEALRQHVAKELFRGEPKETLVMPTLGLLPESHVLFVGITAKDKMTTDSLRDAAAVAAKAATRLKAAAVKQLLPAAVLGGSGTGVGASAGASTFTVKQAAQAMTDGYALGLFVRKTAKKADAKRQSTVASVTFTPAQPLKAAEASNVEAQWKDGIHRGVVFAESVRYARDITNLPGNNLTPQKLAEEAEALAQKYNLDYEIFDEVAAAEEGMGGLLGVGQGSIHPPRMVVIHYEGAPGDDEKWGLIGKGITFDTGGICIKPKVGMEEMISDMGGAATVLGVVRILGELRPAMNAVIVIPTAENMPSDRAFKPGDVLTMMNGTTVEIVNTDAEGRLVLADGLTTALRRGATKLIDVATLTGAVLVALGDVATGSVTNDEPLHQQVIAASQLTGERIWPLPAFPEFRRQLDSDAADMKNGGSRYGAASIAGLFIGAFTEEKPWVHLDVAGTAWLERDKVWEVKGATGVMVRTLGELFTQ